MKTLHQRLLQTIRRLGARAYFGLAAIFSVLIVGDFGISQLLSAAETRMFDTLVSHRLIVPKPDPDIVIIDIDEASLAAMSAKYGRWPWPNEVFGTLVTAIEKQKPAAIVYVKISSILSFKQ